MSKQIFGKAVFYRTTTVPNKKNSKATKVYATAAQRKEIMQTLGDTCVIVFTYYMEKALVQGFDFADVRVAKAIGCSERKVKRARLDLTKAGWFYRTPFPHKSGRRLIMTFLGKKAVTDFKEGNGDAYITIVDLDLG